MSAREPDRPSTFHLIMQVWGESYTKALTELALPALLAPGNIPALAAEWPARFIIHTREEDREAITGSVSYRSLASILPVEIELVDKYLRVDKYSALTRIHRRVLATAEREHAAIVWLVPDAVWSDGSLRAVARAASSGKRAVMQPAIRVRKSEVWPLLSERLNHGERSISARELVRLALDHMHPYYEAFYWDAPASNQNPANVYWRVGREGVLARCFHLHPLMLFPQRRATTFVSTFDDDLPLLACPDYDGFHVVEDSDEAFHIDLTDDDWSPIVPVRRGPTSSMSLAGWGLRAANLHHRRFLTHRIRIHAEACSPAWEVAERRSDRAIARAMLLMALAGAVRMPLEGVFGLRRRALLSTPDALVPALGDATRWRRTVAWSRRKAYLLGCGWVFGRTVACRHLGIDPWHRRLIFNELHAAFFDRVHASDTWAAHRRLALINRHSRLLHWWADWWAWRKKKTRGALRRGWARTVKWTGREIRLGRHRIEMARRAVRIVIAWSSRVRVGPRGGRWTDVQKKRAGVLMRRPYAVLRKRLDLKARWRRIRRAARPLSRLRSIEVVGIKAAKRTARAGRTRYKRFRAVAAAVAHGTRR